jgi:SAM-dependent methyltransferase
VTAATLVRRVERWLKRRLVPYPRLWRIARSIRRRLDRPVFAGSTRCWDRAVGEIEGSGPQGWLDWELIEVEHVRPQVSGDPRVYYLDHFFDAHLPDLPVERALSLGCGGGNLERGLIERGTARKIDAYDSSPESVRLARDLAASAGVGDRIRYEVADVNRIELPEATYDFVVAKMALHHFEGLEHVYGQVRRALKPGGLFMFNEFVGPSRFQWTDLQLELMNHILEVMPASCRRQAPVPLIERPTVREMLSKDPTESVRSSEILPLLQREFEIVEIRPYGGTLLHILLSHMMPTFDLENDDQVAFLRLLFLFERTLVGQGVLASDFAYVVARPRPFSP